jgi:hypothetical protein
MTLFWVGACGMATLAALLDNSLPPRMRPWWRALPRFELKSDPADLHAEADALDNTTSARPQAAPGQPATAPKLTVVETENRRRHTLPFVGKDRRKVGTAPWARHWAAGGRRRACPSPAAGAGTSGRRRSRRCRWSLMKASSIVRVLPATASSGSRS